MIDHFHFSIAFRAMLRSVMVGSMNPGRLTAIVTVLIAAMRLTGQETKPPLQVAYVEREFFIPYSPAMPSGLDVLEVHAKTPGRHPLALLTHGTASAPEDRAHVTPWTFLPQALWFARRSYAVFVVVRRGYGRSGGEIDSRRGGCGRNGTFTEAGEASADDLRAVARYASTQPEVDASTVISAGVSTGGFAQVALAAAPMPGLKAAISFAGGRGGDGKGHNCDEGGLAGAFHGFGKHNKVPMLWIYAENDKWFPPEMAHRFDEAFKKGGGNNKLLMVPPDGEDGHRFYYAIAKWSPLVTEYLSAQNLLPLHDEALPPPSLPAVPQPAGLGDRGAQAFRQFLTNGPFRAFASNDAGAWGSATGQFTQDLADARALERCKNMAQKSVGCRIVMREPQ